MTVKRTHEEFMVLLRKRHGKRFIALTKFNGSHQPIKLRCDQGHVIQAKRAFDYLTGTGGCRKCSDEALKWTDAALRRALKLAVPTVRLAEPYGGHCMIKHLFRCLTCKHEWETAPTTVLHKKAGCPLCAGRNFSGIATAWLEREAKRRRIVIEHAGNVGEYKIPGTRLSVDGFNRRSNTVFEFYGDAWHGNPKVYAPSDKPLGHMSATAGELWAKTKARARRIRSLGYNLVTIWERDFKRSL